MRIGDWSSDVCSSDLREIFGRDAYLALSLRRRPGDFARLRTLDDLGQDRGVRRVAMGDILYHAPERRPLQDVLSAIREKTTVDALGFKRERFMRSEERRVGKECGSTGEYRWVADD